MKHILLLKVGSDLTGPEIQAISDHSKKFGHVSHVVGLAWLRSCLKKRCLDSVGMSDTLSPARLTKMLNAKMLPVAKPEPSLGQPSQVKCMTSVYQLPDLSLCILP